MTPAMRPMMLSEVTKSILSDQPIGVFPGTASVGLL
jgi:hypothetical protein